MLISLIFISQAKDERNYHIFYEMLAGLPSQQKQSLYLQDAETYYYLNQVRPDHYSNKSLKNSKALLLDCFSLSWMLFLVARVETVRLLAKMMGRTSAGSSAPWKYFTSVPKTRAVSSGSCLPSSTQEMSSSRDMRYNETRSNVSCSLGFPSCCYVMMLFFSGAMI